MKAILRVLTLYGGEPIVHWHDEKILFEVENSKNLYLEYCLNIRSYLDSGTQIAGEESVKALQVIVNGLELWTLNLAQLIIILLTRFTGLQQFDIRLNKGENNDSMIYFRMYSSLSTEGHQEDKTITQNNIYGV